MIRIKVNIDEAQAGLRRLGAVLGDLTPVMQDIGEYLVESTRRRFGEGRSPQGAPWAAKSTVTMEAARRRDLKMRKKRRQGLKKRKNRRADADEDEQEVDQESRQENADQRQRHEHRPDSRPLIGVTRRLSREISYFANRTSVEVGSSLIYAAVQQLGAAQGQFGRDRHKHPIPWGRIPARPFLGVSRRDEGEIGEIVAEALARAAGPGAR